jgi:hypothetical protein
MQSYKCEVNKVLEKNEITHDELIEGKEYLLEYNVYNKNKTIRTRGVYINKEIFIKPYIITYFKTKSWIFPMMFHEIHTRYYRPITETIEQLSIERQAFAQSINKLNMWRKIPNKIAWRGTVNKNSVGYDLVKIYF